MAKHNIQAILFDMDGLMLDTEQVYLQAWKHVGETLCLAEFEYASMGTLGMTEEATLQFLTERYESMAFALTIYQNICDYRNAIFDEQPIPHKKGLLPLLEYLRQKKMRTAIASSSDLHVIQKLTQKAGVSGYFQAIAAGDMVVNSKPAPDIFLLAAEKLDVAPCHCMVLEDSINGIRAAHAAGMLPVMIPDLMQPDESIRPLLYAVLPDLHAVISLLENRELLS